MSLGPTTVLSGQPSPPGTAQHQAVQENARKGNYARRISTHMAEAGGRRKRSQLQGRLGASR